MRRTMMALALFSLSSPASAAGVAMDVATFLAKADGLRAKGPLALFSSDLTLLKSEGMAAGKNLREERLAQIAAGKRPAYCAPAGSKMGAGRVHERDARRPVRRPSAHLGSGGDEGLFRPQISLPRDATLSCA